MTGFRLPLRSRFFPFLNWPVPSLALLRGEALAGVSVGLMVIPQGVAYASLAGMPLVTGIYASLLPALIAVLFGASTRLSVGPTALTCLLVGASLTGLAEPSSPKWVGLAVWLALFSGGLQVLLGLGRFGWLLNLVSAPVLMAFTQAAAVLIIGSQLPHLLGTPGWGEIQSLLGQGLAVAEIPAPHAMSTAFGLGSLAILIIARRLRPTFPSVLLVVIGSSMLSRWLDFSASGGAVVG
ncbi:MAG: SulP family inorganic anion transporter, partial [Betaproteobacteria bacterium]|nr:SulP family inorganic anion transporter [Betaproteobacteria bacterium]